MSETAKLSILVPHLMIRAVLFQSLHERLKALDPNVVEVIIYPDDGETLIGSKRQHLLNEATAPYVAFVDDTDDLHPDYFTDVHKALETNPDIVIFSMGKYLDDIKIGSSRAHSYLLPMKSEIAKQIGFKDQHDDAEVDFAIRLDERYPNKTQVVIEKELYLKKLRSRIYSENAILTLEQKDRLQLLIRHLPSELNFGGWEPSDPPVLIILNDGYSFPVDSKVVWQYLDGKEHVSQAIIDIDKQVKAQMIYTDRLMHLKLAIAKHDIQLIEYLSPDYPMVKKNGREYLLHELETEFRNYKRGFVDLNVIARHIIREVFTMDSENNSGDTLAGDVIIPLDQCKEYQDYQNYKE